MISVVIAAILTVIAVVGFGGAVLSLDREDRQAAGGVGALSLTLAMVVLFIGSASTISANRVGVVTEFGRYVEILPSGFHITKPWADIEEFGTRIEALPLVTPVRFEGNSGGTAELLTEWRIDATSSGQERLPAEQVQNVRRLWQDYRTMDAVQQRLVESNVRLALNLVLAGFTPSEGVAGNNLPAIIEQTLQEARNRTEGTGVVIQRITIKGVSPDRQSQDRINRQVQAQADLERTVTTQQIAMREAEIAEIRQRTQTPESLAYECLRILADWNQRVQGEIPEGYNCGSTSSPPLIVGGTR